MSNKIMKDVMCKEKSKREFSVTVSNISLLRTPVYPKIQVKVNLEINCIEWSMVRIFI